MYTRKITWFLITSLGFIPEHCKVWGHQPHIYKREGSLGENGDGLGAKSCLTLVTPWTAAHQVLCPWHFPGKNTGLGCHFLLQVIVPIQGLNLRLLCCRCLPYQLSHHGSPGGGVGENGYIHTYDLVLRLCTRNYHNILNHFNTNINSKVSEQQ